MTALKRLLIVLVLAGWAGHAAAEDAVPVDPVVKALTDADGKLSPAALAKLRSLVDSDPQLHDRVMKAAEQEIKDTYEHAAEDKASAIFAEKKRFVIAAYGVMWGLLVVFLGMMWRRQRVLEREIDAMAAKLAKVKAEAAS